MWSEGKTLKRNPKRRDGLRVRPEKDIPNEFAWIFHALFIYVSVNVLRAIKTRTNEKFELFNIPRH